MDFNLDRSDQSNKLREFPVVEIVLTGKELRARVDTPDLVKVLSVSTRWHARWDATSKTHYVSALRTHVLLHRVITGAPDGLTVDHWDHDGLNNRESNLRIVSQAVNSINRRVKLGITGFRGVTRRNDRYRASVMVNRKRILLGDFYTPEAAHEAVLRFRSGQ